MSKTSYVYEVIVEYSCHGRNDGGSFTNRRENRGMFRKLSKAIEYKNWLVHISTCNEDWYDVAKIVYEDDMITTFVCFDVMDSEPSRLTMVSYSIHKRWVD